MEFELVRLEPDSLREDFTCDDQDLDEFYKVDSVKGAAELLSVTYALTEKGRTVAFFSLSNDSIKREIAPKAYNRIARKIPNEKRYTSLPAAKIGRIGVCAERKGGGVGTKILDYLKYSFTHNNKTGCRFLLVDAYSSDVVLRFYQKNGFRFLTDQDSQAKTRIMYFDLAQFRE